jgi:drug/metabolite transporter (DMT)-like permease
MTVRAIPAGLAIRLALAIALDSAVQILWKLAAMRLPDSGSASALVEAALHQPLFLLIAALFIWQLVNWLWVLERSDLSYSQPITSLSFVSVFVLSALFLGERIGASKMLGIALVLAGVWFISRTPHDSRRGDDGTA